MSTMKPAFKQLLQDQIKSKITGKDVDSPYAKYNSRGQLMCIVCGTQVKSAIIWQAHINKRSHKENLARLKERQEQLNNKSSVKNFSFKRPLQDSTVVEANEKKVFIQPKGILKNASTRSSNHDTGSNPVLVKLEIKAEGPPYPDAPSTTIGLPEDFFDDGLGTVKSEPQEVSVNSAQENEALPGVSGAGDTLPEGFFDDPVADAKARKVEYKDKEAEEWSTFLREVSAAEVISREIIAEDKEEAALETQIQQTNEQIKCLQRIVELDRRKTTQLKEKNLDSSLADDGDSSDEEFSTVIWRTKNSLI